MTACKIYSRMTKRLNIQFFQLINSYTGMNLLAAKTIFPNRAKFMSALWIFKAIKIHLNQA